MKKKTETFLPYVGLNDDVSVKVLYGDGYEFSPTNLMGYDKSLVESSINPLSSKEGDIAFQIPDSVASAADELLVQFHTRTENVLIKIR